MVAGPENYVKDIESSSVLGKLELSVLNSYVDAEFRSFAKDNDINTSNLKTKEEEFNKKIDEIVAAEKEKAIFAEIIKLKFELSDLATQVNLTNSQNEVRDNTEQSDSKTIENKINGKFTLYN
jgi:hypothetical protein